MGHRGPFADDASSVRQVNATWGHFTSLGGTLAPYVVTGRSNSTSLVGACEIPVLGDHPTHHVSPRFLITGAAKQEAG